jgi:acetyl-CoA C-acetyltransferase
MIHDGLWDPYNDIHMGNAGDLCAREHDISRQVQDELARESYRRALLAQASGALAQEIVPVIVKGRGGETRVELDEEPARAKLDKMASLKPAFDPAGTVTAANASKINDGAAALVLATAAEAERRGLRPIGRLVAQATFSQQPEWFTTAPIAAVRKALERAGLGVEAIDLFEINEAFAVVALACARELGIDHGKLNVRGGAVALGHPIGCSGARILVTLLDALAERGGRYGCAGICIGGGEATAMVVERFAG